MHIKCTIPVLEYLWSTLNDQLCNGRSNIQLINDHVSKSYLFYSADIQAIKYINYKS